MKNLGIGMYRPHMNDIPLFDLPPGYSYRPFSSPDDPEIWVRIQAAANEGTSNVTYGTYRKEFEGNEELLPDRSWFVVSDRGEDVASITAWWWDTQKGRLGLIHWVAVLPVYQGKGIGKAIMTKAMLRLAQEYDDVYLNTSTARLAAIKVYLDFGFRLDMNRADAEEALADLAANLKHAALGNT